MIIYQILLIFIGIFASICEDSDKREINEIYTHLGSKTAYRFNHNTDTNLDKKNSKCAKKIWMLIGHGTRYASEEELNEMNEGLPSLKELIIRAFAHRRSTLHYNKIATFDDWMPFPGGPNDSLKLVREGENEMFYLASRMQRRYPKLFPTTFSNNSFLFKYVKEDTIIESARYFALGIFGKEKMKDAIFVKPSKRDLRILRPYKICSKWQEDIGPKAMDEKESFFDGTIVHDTVKEITKRLGLEQLSKDKVWLMYMACAYETSWSKHQKSPWCMVFNKKSIRVFEYLEDLEQYWLHGYGFNLTYQQACLAVRDLVLFFNDRRINRRASIYFTDPGSVLKFLAHLELYKSIPLTHKNYDPRMERPWRSSKIGGFGTNVAFILYRCKGKKFISMLHNERFVMLPACPGNNTCDFETFRKYYDKSINHCNFDDICENN